MRATNFAAAKMASTSPGIGLGIGGRPRPVDREIARRLRPDLRRAGCERGARVGHRGERVVFDRDELGGILRGERALGDDHRHRPRRYARPARPRAPGGAASTSPLPPRPVSGGWRPMLPIPSMSFAVNTPTTPGALSAARDVDADDAGESVRRAHEIGVGLVRQRNIGGVAAVAAHQNVVLHARLHAPRGHLVFASMLCSGMSIGIKARPL